jgi:hypothetical protein
MTPCIVCQTAEADRGTVCAGCLARIDHDLERIAELTRHAADQLIPETRPGNGGRSVPGSRPPLDVAALDDAMGHDVLPILDSWERLVRDFYGLTPLGIATERPERAPQTPQNATGVVPDPYHSTIALRASVGFLRSWLLRMAETADFPLADLADEMHQLHGRLKRYDPDRAGPRNGIPVSCPADHPDADGRGCDQALRTDGSDIVVCPRCYTQWTPEDLLAPLARTILPASTLITLDLDHPNPRERLRNWTRRGRITPAAHAANPNGGHDVPLYRLGDYRTLLASVNRLDKTVTTRAT